MLARFRFFFASLKNFFEAYFASYFWKRERETWKPKLSIVLSSSHVVRTLRNYTGVLDTIYNKKSLIFSTTVYIKATKMDGLHHIILAKMDMLEL